MPGLQYTWPDDDYIPGIAASLSFSGTADPEYLVEKLGNLDPSDPFKTPDTSVVVDGDLGEAKVIGLLAIVHSNFDPDGGSPGLGLELLLDDNASFTSPETFPLSVPPYQEDGHPGYIHLDFVAEGYGLKTYRYFRVQNTNANSVSITMGALILCAGWRELPEDFQAEAVDDEDHPIVRNLSEGGGVPTKYAHEYRPMWFRGDVIDTTQDDDEAIRRWNRAAGGAFKPFLVHLHLPIDEPSYVFFENGRLPRKRKFRTEEGMVLNGYSLAFEEAGRGRPPEPSPV